MKYLGTGPQRLGDVGPRRTGLLATRKHVQSPEGIERFPNLTAAVTRDESVPNPLRIGPEELRVEGHIPDGHGQWIGQIVGQGEGLSWHEVSSRECGSQAAYV